MTDNGAKALAERLRAIGVASWVADAILANGAVFLTAEEAERLRTLSEAASEGPYVFNGHPFTLAGADAAFAVAAANFVRAALTEPSHD